MEFAFNGKGSEQIIAWTLIYEVMNKIEVQPCIPLQNGWTSGSLPA
jgi:hypothetical protein